MSKVKAGRLTMDEIAKSMGVSRATLWRRLKEQEMDSSTFIENTENEEVVLLMDTTYWGRNFGVVIIKDNISGRVLWHKFIERKERISDYEEGIEHVRGLGKTILGIVSDGFKGLRTTFKQFNFQHCQFHAVQYVKIKLTSNPQSEAGQELLKIAKEMCHTDKESFVGSFTEWESRWKAYLQEKSKDSDGKERYKHQRLRSAWRSLKTNMEWLWTFYDHPEAKLPNTNNAMEGLNSSLKDHLRRHRGISLERRKIIISEFLKGHKPKRNN